MLKKTLESPLDYKEIQPVHPKGDQSWVFTGRTDVEAETPIVWPPDVKCWLILKDPDARRDWRQEEKGMTEDEMVGWHHRLNGRGFGCTPGVGDGQGGLACYSSWGLKELDRTEWLNWILPKGILVSQVYSTKDRIISLSSRNSYLEKFYTTFKKCVFFQGIGKYSTKFRKHETWNNI